MNNTTFYQNMPILVTGGAGFIGSHLIERLVKLGAHVRVLDNFSTGLRSNLGTIQNAIELIEGDITDFQTCLEAARGTKLIFHLAANTSVPESSHQPVHYHATNVTGTCNLLEAARRQGRPRVIFSSSAAVYGSNEGVCSETTTTQPLSWYGHSKLMGEWYCKNYTRLFGLSTVCLRYFNVYGSRQRADLPHPSFVALLQHNMQHNLPVVLYGDGTQQRDFIHVNHIVEANLVCGASPQDFQGDCFNIGTGKSISLLELMNTFKPEFPHYQHTPLFLPAREGDIYYSAADCSKYKNLIEKHLNFLCYTEG